MKFGGFVRNLDDAAGLSGATARVYTFADNALVATAATDADGRWEVEENGYGGPYVARVQSRGRTFQADVGGGWQQGALSLPELPVALRLLGSGVLPREGDQLEVAALSALGRTVTVASGAALLAGYPFVACESTTLTLDAVSANPRIDAVVARVAPFGAGNEGTSLLAVVKGTEAASPTAPALADSASAYELRLADVRVGTSGIESVTDRRAFCFDARAEPQPVVGFARASGSFVPFPNTGGIGSTVDDAATASLTLEGGVVYDVQAEYACIYSYHSAANEVALAVRIGGDAGTGVANVAARRRLGNGHAARVVGDGSAVAVAARLTRTASNAMGSAFVACRYLRALAIPRRDA